MGKKISVWSGVTLFVLTLAFGGCGKKEEPAPPPPAPPPVAPAPEAPGGAPTGPGAMAPAPGGEATPGAPAAPGDKPMEKKDEGMKKK